VGGTKEGSGVGDFRYNPRLIELLCDDHLEILGVVERSELLLQKGRLDKVEGVLKELRDLLKGHQVKEDVRLLKYLERRLQGDAARFGTLDLVRLEREQINRTIDEFLQKYGSLSAQPGFKESFKAELQRIGQLLVGQFEREEQHLFPLYSDAG